MTRPYFMRNPHTFGPTFIKGSLGGEAWENAGGGVQYEAAEKFFLLRGLFPAEPLSDKERPTTLQIKGNHKSIGAMFITKSSLIMVQQPMKDLIEELEPGVHEFWPIEVTLKNGEPYDLPCYGFRAMNLVAAVIPEKSNLEPAEGRDGMYHPKEVLTDTRAYFDMTLRASAIEGLHIWNDTQFLFGEFFFSEAFRAEAKSRKLKMFALDKLKAE